MRTIKFCSVVFGVTSRLFFINKIYCAWRCRPSLALNKRRLLMLNDANLPRLTTRDEAWYWSKKGRFLPRDAMQGVYYITIWYVPLMYWVVTIWSVGGKSRRRLQRRAVSLTAEAWRRQRYASAAYAVMRCPPVVSVRPSARSWILSKRINVITF